MATQTPPPTRTPLPRRMGRAAGETHHPAPIRPNDSAIHRPDTHRRRSPPVRLHVQRHPRSRPLQPPRRLPADRCLALRKRSEEHTSELQSLMRISYAVFCLTKNKPYTLTPKTYNKYTCKKQK